MSKELGLYLTSAMNQSIHNHQKKKYSRGYKAIWTGRVENDDILLQSKQAMTENQSLTRIERITRWLYP